MKSVSIGPAFVDVPAYQVSHDNRHVELADDGLNNSEHLCKMTKRYDIAVTQGCESDKAEVQQVGFKSTTCALDTERSRPERVQGVKCERPDEAEYDEEIDGSEDLGSGDFGARNKRFENKHSAEDEERKDESGHCQAQGFVGK